MVKSPYKAISCSDGEGRSERVDGMSHDQSCDLYLWHVAHVSARHLVASGSWSLTEHRDVAHGQVELPKDAAKEGGLATPTGAQQPIATAKYLKLTITSLQESLHTWRERERERGGGGGKRLAFRAMHSHGAVGYIHIQLLQNYLGPIAFHCTSHLYG